MLTGAAEDQDIGRKVPCVYSLNYSSEPLNTDFARATVSSVGYATNKANQLEEEQGGFCNSSDGIQSEFGHFARGTASPLVSPSNGLLALLHQLTSMSSVTSWCRLNSLF